MKNITLAIDEDLLTEVRKYAARNNTTVNGMVRDYLSQIVGKEDRIANAKSRILKLSEESKLDLGDWKWNREEIYDRPVFFRHEHTSVSRVEEAGRPTEEGDCEGNISEK